MKLVKKHLFAFALLFGLMLSARASLERDFTYALHPDTPQTSYDAALDHFDGVTKETFFTCIDRVNGQSSGTIVSGEFMIEFDSNNTATVTWNFTSTDRFFLGVYVAGFNGRGNLYENIDDPEGTQFHGTAEVDAPRLRPGGGLPGISHIDFFCGRITSVPDSGATFMLLVGGLAGLVLAQRSVSSGSGIHRKKN